MLRLTARWVLPISSEPIEFGEVVVDGERIVSCGPKQGENAGPSDVQTIDLGDAALLPGLVNVHSHLEYTALRGFLEDVAFFPWIRALTAVKGQLTAEDWLASARLGAAECIAAGITTVGDNCDAEEAAPRAVSEAGLRARLYQEIFGIDHRVSVEEPLGALDAKLQRLAGYASDRIEIGVSPHAPFTVRPALLRAVADYCDTHRLRTSIHVAESVAESDLIERGEGPFAEMLAGRGIAWQAAAVSPTRYLADHGAITRSTLCVHCVRQSPADADIVAQAQASIAHCPKSNAKLGVGCAPLAEWLERPNIAVGLGTDSAVSNNTLDLFEEMRFGLLMQRAYRGEIALGARIMLESATIGGAHALGWSDRIGSLDAGKLADIIAVRLDSLHICPVSDPYAALVYSAVAGDVCLTMASGRILYRDGLFAEIDVDSRRRRAIEARGRIVVARSM